MSALKNLKKIKKGLLKDLDDTNISKEMSDRYLRYLGNVEWGIQTIHSQKAKEKQDGKETTK